MKYYTLNNIYTIKTCHKNRCIINNVENVGGQIHDELWIPLEEFNKYIVGKIEVIVKHQ